MNLCIQKYWNFPKKEKKFFPDSKITVRYVNREGQEIQTKWQLSEYFKKIGFSGNKKNGIKPFDRFMKLVHSGVPLEETMRAIHRRTIQERIEKAYSFDQSLERKAMLGREAKNERERQKMTQDVEDTFFTLVLKDSNYIFPVELPIYHDYMDAIDVLVEIDLNELLKDKWTEDPVYIGVQRTLLNEGHGRLEEKREKIKKRPLWYLPEYPERNPVLRVLYRENPDEYYLEDGTPRLEMLRELTREENIAKFKKKKEKGDEKLLQTYRVLLGNTKEEIRENFSKKNTKAKENKRIATLKMMAKTLDVLYQAMDDLKEYQKDKTHLSQHQKIYDRYERAITKIISIIEEDNNLTRDKVKKLLSI